MQFLLISRGNSNYDETSTKHDKYIKKGNAYEPQ